MDELEESIQKQKNEKVPYSYKITAEMIKYIGQKLKELMLKNMERRGNTKRFDGVINISNIQE